VCYLHTPMRIRGSLRFSIFSSRCFSRWASSSAFPIAGSTSTFPALGLMIGALAHPRCDFVSRSLKNAALAEHSGAAALACGCSWWPCWAMPRAISRHLRSRGKGGALHACSSSSCHSVFGGAPGALTSGFARRVHGTLRLQVGRGKAADLRRDRVKTSKLARVPCLCGGANRRLSALVVHRFTCPGLPRVPRGACGAMENWLEQCPRWGRTAAELDRALAAEEGRKEGELVFETVVAERAPPRAPSAFTISLARAARRGGLGWGSRHILDGQTA